MDVGLSNELVFEAVVVLILAAGIVRRDLTAVVALLIAAVRVGVPVVYFAWYYDGAWTILDDFSYFTDGQRMLADGFNPLTALFTVEGFEELQMLSGGNHILYTWWNVLAQYLFGPNYFTAVLLNVLVTFVTAFVLRRTMELLRFPRPYCLGLQLLFLLHWDMIAWSSFVNLKDPIVQLLTVMSLYFVTRFFQRHDLYSIVGFLAVAQMFAIIRYYVPLIVLLTAMLWMTWQWKSNLRYVLIPLTVLAAYGAFPMLQEQAYELYPAQVLFGTARMLITPIPGRIDERYSYLLIPSLLHLAFLLPAVVGFVGLWRANTSARLYLLYLALIITLYAMTDELQGPRHRFQVAFIFVWIQFHFLWMLRPSRQARTYAPISFPTATRRPASPAPRPVGALA